MYSGTSTSVCTLEPLLVCIRCSSQRTSQDCVIEVLVHNIFCYDFVLSDMCTLRYTSSRYLHFFLSAVVSVSSDKTVFLGEI